jgi:hypothetical protein
LRILALTTIFFCNGHLALADESPIVGYFRYIGVSEHQSDENDQLACALGFFRQDENGNGNDYQLDVEKFVATGEITYRIATTFSCRYDPASQIEMCNATSPVETFDAGLGFYLYDSLAPDRVQFQFFATMSEATAAAVARKAGQAPVSQDKLVRCSGWSEAVLAPFIDTTPIGPDDEHRLAGFAYPFSTDRGPQNLQDAEKIRNTILGQ